MRKIIITVLLLASIALTGCDSGNSADNQKDTDGKLHIATTVYPLQYFAEEIGNEFVTVDTIYPPGSDEHTYEPSQKDMINLADSDLFIYVGLGLEGFVENAKETLKDEGVILLEAGKDLDVETEEHAEEATHEEDEHADEHEHEEEAEHSHDGHDHGDIDPHVWVDPLYAKGLAEAIKNELVAQLPEHKEEIEKNYSALASQLDSLNTQFETITQNAKVKEFIVSHAAYGYWEKRYGIEQLSISGMSSSDEPTQKELKEIISTAKEHNLRYIFFEQNVSSKLADIVQEEMNAEPLVLHNLSVLTEDDIQKERTYFSIMEDNLKALETGLSK
ncbi:metal ABC transporter solute-binding protein, Zn/Mn family [Robertmurraya kyonggiensis]|uniref:Adhesin n=1 Tax=Robertmurraya kyonggiensis TaxID=1037680 RepID=A0A4U1D282_9BACI|nr:zinc ABC transporter substrate-binding protein [Robertmurraya kyonggiensis]TKC15908.1 adhesin [Robertmurraya kyonggiensis]